MRYIDIYIYIRFVQGLYLLVDCPGCNYNYGIELRNRDKCHVLFSSNKSNHVYNLYSKPIIFIIIGAIMYLKGVSTFI